MQMSLSKIINFQGEILLFHINKRSSLIYSTSARHERHKCDTSDTNGARATQVRHREEHFHFKYYL